MRTEMETPRAGNEQGLVIQRIWSTDGVLVATCIQEDYHIKRTSGLLILFDVYNPTAAWVIILLDNGLG